MGTVVALYPGLVYNREDIATLDRKVKTTKVFHSLHLRGLSWFFCQTFELFVCVAQNLTIQHASLARFDGATIDGRGAVSARPNLYALGHLVNHPPPDTLPNVMPCPFDFPLSLEQRQTQQEMFGVWGHIARNHLFDDSDEPWPTELEPYIPNKFYQRLDSQGPPVESCQVRCYVFLDFCVM